MPNPFDETRFIEALTRHQPALEAYCHANLAHREDAREVLQATCVKLWQKAADWDPETEFLPWAFTVARFTILSHYRDQQRERLIFDEDVELSHVNKRNRLGTEDELNNVEEGDSDESFKALLDAFFLRARRL